MSNVCWFPNLTTNDNNGRCPRQKFVIGILHSNVIEACIYISSGDTLKRCLTSTITHGFVCSLQQALSKLNCFPRKIDERPLAPTTCVLQLDGESVQRARTRSVSATSSSFIADFTGINVHSAERLGNMERRDCQYDFD